MKSNIQAAVGTYIFKETPQLQEVEVLRRPCRTAILNLSRHCIERNGDGVGTEKFC